jgi:hypothetical protein
VGVWWLLAFGFRVVCGWFHVVVVLGWLHVVVVERLGIDTYADVVLGADELSC